MHAREWISCASVNWVIYNVRKLNKTISRRNSDDTTYLLFIRVFYGFVQDTHTNKNLTCFLQIFRILLNSTSNSFLSKYEFWFVPIANPDGYEYTHRVCSIK